MNEPPDLLLITCNRRPYVEKVLPRLLGDPADFRLYCWDNGSTDGVADIIASLDDPRVVTRRMSPHNVGQADPCCWFLDAATSGLVGKLDDDILLPHGWIERIAPMVTSQDTLGMIGCWAYMPEDWDEGLARRNIVRVGPYRVFQTTSIGGQSFLARRSLLRRYLSLHTPGLPVERTQMSLDGWVSGYVLPIIFAHHMDDPRSPHCLMRDASHPAEARALTMRRLGFETLEDYAAWIAADARTRLTVPYAKQLKKIRAERDRSLWGRARRKVLRALGAAQ